MLLSKRMISSIANCGRVRHPPGVFCELVLIVFTLVSCGCQHGAKNSDTKAVPEVAPKECQDTATRFLGSGVVVEKCGHLIGGLSVELVALVKLRKFAEDQNGIPISRLIILQKVDSQWKDILNVAK